MKPFLTILLAAFTLGLPLVFGQLACDYHPVSTVIAPPPPTFTPTFTPTSTPILVYVDLTASAFSPAAVTVAYSPTGSSGIVFTNLDGFPHTVQPDDGTGTCITNQFVNPGMSVTFTFSALGTINYHCWFHSSYFGPPCDGTATGMVGTLVIQ